MAEDLLAFDEAYQKKKKTIIIISAILIILLGGALLVGLEQGKTPQSTAIAVITTIAPSPTERTTLPPTNTPTAAPPTLLPTQTPSSIPNFTTTPTTTPMPIRTELPPTLPPSTPPSPTPTLTPSSTPQAPTPTPTLTATIAAPTLITPVIESPISGSELPGEALIIYGTAAPGSRIQIYKGDILLGEAPVDQNGNWSLIPATRLTAGEHTIVALDTTSGKTSTPVTFTLLEALLPITGAENKPFNHHDH